PSRSCLASLVHYWRCFCKNWQSAGRFPRRRSACRWFGGDVYGPIRLVLLAYFHYRRIDRCDFAFDVVRLGAHFYFVANRRTSDYERDHFATDRCSVVIYRARASRRSHSGSVNTKDDASTRVTSWSRKGI